MGGNYVSVAIAAVAAIWCILLMSANPDGRAPLVFVFALVVMMIEFFIGYPLQRKFGRRELPVPKSSRLGDSVTEYSRRVGIDNVDSVPVTVGGVERKSGYKGPLFDAFLKPSHVREALQGDARQDLVRSLRRLAAGTLLSMCLAAAVVCSFTLPVMGVTVDWSACEDHDVLCKVRRFDEEIFQGNFCQVRSSDIDERMYDRSGMEQMLPFNAYMSIASTAGWFFVNIGTTMITIVFFDVASANSLKMMWATSLSATAVMCFVYWLPFGFTNSLRLLPLVWAFVHALHWLMLELCAETTRFGRFARPRCMAFLGGFFTHFLVGVIMMMVLFGVDMAVSQGALPVAMVTIVMSTLISLGETILQFVFSRLHEAPLSAGALLISSYQLALYSRMRSYFVTLTISNLLVCSFQGGRKTRKLQ